MNIVRCAALALLLSATAAAHAARYAIVPGKSSLTFTGAYEGEPFEGRFARFTADVSIDAGNPAATSVAAEIDVASVDTQNAERDETLATPDFFDVARFPKARFRTTACRGAAPRFVCDGRLTIRDRTRPIAFPFTIATRADGRTTLTARVVLERLAFDVGRGDWSDTALIADEVTVRVALVLAPKP